MPPALGQGADSARGPAAFEDPTRALRFSVSGSGCPVGPPTAACSPPPGILTGFVRVRPRQSFLKPPRRFAGAGGESTLPGLLQEDWCAFPRRSPRCTLQPRGPSGTCHSCSFSLGQAEVATDHSELDGSGGGQESLTQGDKQRLGVVPRLFASETSLQTDFVIWIKGISTPYIPGIGRFPVSICRPVSVLMFSSEMSPKALCSQTHVVCACDLCLGLGFPRRIPSQVVYCEEQALSVGDHSRHYPESDSSLMALGRTEALVWSSRLTSQRPGGPAKLDSVSAGSHEPRCGDRPRWGGANPSGLVSWT